MFKKVLAKIFAVSPEVIEFISDSRKNYRRRLAVLIPLVIWTSLFDIISPLFIKWNVDSLTEGWTSLGIVNLNSVWSVFLVIVAGFGVIQILNYFFEYLKNVLLLRLNKQSESFLEDKFNTFLTKFDGAFLSAENNVRLVRNLQWNIRENQEKLLNLGQKVTETLIGISALIFVLPLLHPLLLILILVSVIVDSGMDYLQNQAWRSYEMLENRQNEQRWELKWRINDFFNRLLENGWINQILMAYKDRRAKWIKTSVEQGISDQRYIFMKNFSRVFLNVGSLVIAGWLFIDGQIPIGTFVVFELYISRVKSQLQGIGEVFRWIFELRFELFRYDFLLHILPKLDYTITDKPKIKNIETLEIKNLDFSYPQFYQEEKDYFTKMRARIVGATASDSKKSKNSLKPTFWSQPLVWIRNRLSNQALSIGDRERLQKELKQLESLFEKTSQATPVLKKINLTFKKGLVYGIIGHNGAGKTTLTKLIKRTIDPSDGQILVNSKDLKTIDPLYWKGFLASIQQENFLWDSLSVRENLVLGLDENESKKITDKNLKMALEKVGLGEKITDLDLIIGENLELSGGQIQLLEIARTYIQKKPIIILDEGTNQLDALKEQKVLQLISEIKQDAIVLFITHRMTTTQKCDQIVILEEGKVTGQGTPRQLLNSSKPNLFKTFWQVQVENKGVD